MDEKRPILIQGAMLIELKHILESLENKAEMDIQGYKFWKGNMYGKLIIVSKTDIGSINATIATTIGILKFRPHAIINQGIAGACNRNVHKYDVVLGKNCTNTNCYKTRKREKGQGSNPLDWELITFTSDDEEKKEEQLCSDNHLLNIAQEACMSYDKGSVFKETLGSGDCWNKEADRLDWIYQNTGAICADMESIGTYTVANKFKVPVLGLRVISDNELLNELYNRDTSIEAQRITMEIIKKV